jgi:hypothetical protein
MEAAKADKAAVGKTAAEVAEAPPASKAPEKVAAH